MTSLIFKLFGLISIVSCHDPDLEIDNVGKNLRFEHSPFTVWSLTSTSSSGYKFSSISKGRRCLDHNKVWIWKYPRKMFKKCRKHQIGKGSLRPGRSITYTLHLNLCPRGMRFNARRNKCVPRFFG